MSNQPPVYNVPPGQPPAWGYPPGAVPPASPPGSVPPPSNRRLWLWIGGGIAVVLLLCCVAFAFFFGATIFGVSKATAGPRDATNGYFDAIKAHDYAGAQTYLSASLRTSTTPASLQATWSQRETRNGAVSAFSSSSTNVQNNNTATVTGTLKYANGASETKTIDLVKENGDWKLTNLP